MYNISRYVKGEEGILEIETSQVGGGGALYGGEGEGEGVWEV